MTTIPVLVNFDSSKPIGTMTIDETRLPPGDGFVFSLGFMIETMSYKADKPKIEKIELLCVSLLTDEQYLAYMKSQGKTAS